MVFKVEFRCQQLLSQVVCLINVEWITLFNPSKTVWSIYTVVASYTTNSCEFIYVGRSGRQRDKRLLALRLNLLSVCTSSKECWIWAVDLVLPQVVSVPMSLLYVNFIVFYEYLTLKIDILHMTTCTYKVSQPLHCCWSQGKAHFSNKGGIIGFVRVAEKQTVLHCSLFTFHPGPSSKINAPVWVTFVLHCNRTK